VIIVDASVVIAHLDASNPRHDRAEGLLLGVDEEQLGASPLTLAELLVGPARTGRLDQAAAALSQLGVAPVKLTDNAPLRLARLRAGTGLKLPDCCVLLAAEQSGGAVATLDRRLAAVAADHGLLVRRR